MNVTEDPRFLRLCIFCVIFVLGVSAGCYYRDSLVPDIIKEKEEEPPKPKPNPQPIEQMAVELAKGVKPAGVDAQSATVIQHKKGRLDVFVEAQQIVWKKDEPVHFINPVVYRCDETGKVIATIRSDYADGLPDVEAQQSENVTPLDILDNMQMKGNVRMSKYVEGVEIEFARKKTKEIEK